MSRKPPPHPVAPPPPPKPPRKPNPLIGSVSMFEHRPAGETLAALERIWGVKDA